MIVSERLNLGVRIVVDHEAHVLITLEEFEYRLCLLLQACACVGVAHNIDLRLLGSTGKGEFIDGRRRR
ncbi:hypothetical protein D3C83_137750 [compost metagenome]